MAFVIVTSILIASVLLLITEWLPIDLIAVGIMVALMATGILTPPEALAGFANSAVITIASMFILSRGLMRTGALGFVSERMIEYSRGSEKRILLIAMVGALVPSAFLNNTPVVVLFVSIIMSVCCEYGLSPSRYLIPISYGSIIGGTCTLIGTSTNLIVSDFSVKYGYEAIGMFELSAVGIPLAFLIVAFLYFAAPRFLPQHKAPVCELSDKDAPRYLAELLVASGSDLIGRDPLAYLAERHAGLELFEVVRGPLIYFPEREKIGVREGDLLLVKGTANDLVDILRAGNVELPYKVEGTGFGGLDEKLLIVELIIPPHSRWLGEQPIGSRMQEEIGIRVIAVKRHGIHYAEQKIRHLRLSIGDVLLIQCSREKLEEIRNKPDVIILEDVHHRIVNRRKAPLALLIFGGMVAAAAAGLVPIVMSAFSAAFLMIVTGCVQVRDAYRSLDVRVLLMIIGTIALGAAMEKTGAARIYAAVFLTPFHGQDPALILAAFILLTSVITELMSNSATAVLLLPIGISTAVSIGVDPRPFVIGVCFGASCGFAIPTGYQTNLLVYGQGGYRFSDFLKLGIPVHLMTWLVSSLLIPVLWDL